MFRRVRFALVAGIVLALVTAATSYARSPRHSDPACSINPSPAAVGQIYVVSVSGLPTDTAINLWVTDPSGNTVGRPLGSTPDGTYNLNESSSSAGTWTYAFSGPVKQNTVIYSSCSVAAS
jgi:hypothetical protein